MKRIYKGKWLSIISILVLAVVISSCGNAKSEKEAEARKEATDIVEDNYAKDETKEEATKEEAGSNTKQTSYPLTITTYASDGSALETTYQEAPKKVLAVYQGSIETMLALGLEDSLVATAGLDNEVPEDMKASFSKVEYLDEFAPSKETVTMLEPDMILSWGSYFQDKTLGDANEWIDKGVNIYINSNTRPANGETAHNRTLENEYTDILNMGKIFNVQDKAEQLVQDMKDTIQKVTDETKDISEKPSVLIAESFSDTYTNYGDSSIAGDMITQLGGALANPDGKDMGKEDIIVANPDVLFVVYMPYSGDDPETVKQEKLDEFLEDLAFANLDAVKNGRVIPIMLSEMYASATRTKDGIVTFANGLYPDLSLQ